MIVTLLATIFVALVCIGMTTKYLIGQIIKLIAEVKKELGKS